MSTPWSFNRSVSSVLLWVINKRQKQMKFEVVAVSESFTGGWKTFGSSRLVDAFHLFSSRLSQRCPQTFFLNFFSFSFSYFFLFLFLTAVTQTLLSPAVLCAVELSVCTPSSVVGHGLDGLQPGCILSYIRKYMTDVFARFPSIKHFLSPHAVCCTKSGDVFTGSVH